MSELRKHFESAHPSEELHSGFLEWSCRMCGPEDKEFDDEEELAAHMAADHKEEAVEKKEDKKEENKAETNGTMDDDDLGIELESGASKEDQDFGGKVDEDGEEDGDESEPPPPGE